MHMFSCMETYKGLIVCTIMSLTNLEVFVFNANKSLLVQHAAFELNYPKQCDFHLF